MTEPQDLYQAASQAQQTATDPHQTVWVTASAGAGKTKILTDRVLRLMIRGPDKGILCLTYTRAGAAEMLNRITSRLAEWVTLPDGRLEEDIRLLTQDEVDRDDVKTARHLFARFLDNPRSLQVHTLHAFCESLLARFPIEANIPPHFRLIDEAEQRFMLDESLEACLREAADQPDGDLASSVRILAERLEDRKLYDLMTDFVRNWPQFSSSLQPNPSSLIARLTVLAARALNIDPHTTPETVISEKLRPPLAEESQLREAATMLCDSSGKTDKERGLALSHLLSPSEWCRPAFFRNYINAFLTQKGEIRKQLISKAFAKKRPDIASALMQEAERVHQLTDDYRAAELKQSSEAALRLGLAVLTQYRSAKSQRARLDYDDLILHAYDLLKRLDAAWVAYRLDARIDHLLLDEAQDISPEQWGLIRAMTNEFFAGEGARSSSCDPFCPRTLFVVGDVKQSIFSFQGADPRAFSTMRSTYNHDVKAAGHRFLDVPLNYSFRSQQPILTLVDAVFTTDSQGVEPRWRPHYSIHAGPGGCATLWPLLTVRQSENSTAAARQAETAPARLASMIASWVRDQLDSGLRIMSPKDRPIHAGDILILLHRRDPLADPLVKALKCEGIPVAGADRVRLLEQSAVCDMIALIRFLLLPTGDDFSLAELLRGPWIGLSEADLFTLAHERPCSLWEHLCAQADKRMARIANWLKGLLTYTDILSPFALLSEVLTRPTPATIHSGRAALRARLGADSEEAIDELLALALDYEHHHPPSLRGFLSSIETKNPEIKRDLAATHNAVRIMTIHGAKGLEAPIVILPDTTRDLHDTHHDPCFFTTGDHPTLEPKTEDSALLFSPSKDDDPSYVASLRERSRVHRAEESRRLLYVALTRAAERILICGWMPKHGRLPKRGCWYKMVEDGFRHMQSQGLEVAEESPPVNRQESDESITWEGETLVFAEKLPESTAPEPPESVSLPAFPSSLLWPPPSESHASKTLNPSEDRQDDLLAISPLARPLDRGKQGLRRGTLIHRSLEILPQIVPEQRADVLSRFLNAYGQGFNSDDRAALKQEILAIVDDSFYAPIFAAGSQAEVPVLGNVTLPGQKQEPVAGKIDRLLVTSREVWIVDYKSHRPPPRNAEGIPPSHRRQMALYRELIQPIYPKQTIRCFLLWTFGPRWMELSSSMLEQALTPDSAGYQPSSVLTNP